MARADTVEEIIQIVREVMAERLPADVALGLDTEFEAVGVDSFEGIQIVAAVQERFGVEIDPAAAEDALTIGELHAIVNRLDGELGAP